MLKSPDTVQFIDDNNGSDRERDNDSLASDIESEQEEEEPTDKYAKIQEEKAAEQASLLNQRTSGRQTGVKGVISDYRYLRKLEKSNSSNSQMSSGSGISSGQLDSLNQIENSFNNLELDELEDNLSDDEAFFEQYKQKRLEELRKNQRNEKIGASKNEFNQAIFNKVYELNEDNYIQVIDEQSPKTHVIIHLYQRHIADCSKLNEILDELCLEYQHTLFCRIQSHLVSTKFDEIVLPTVLVYQGGNLIHNFVKFVDELRSPHLDIENVEGCLFKYGILSNSDRTTN